MSFLDGYSDVRVMVKRLKRVWIESSGISGLMAMCLCVVLDIALLLD